MGLDATYTTPMVKDPSSWSASSYPNRHSPTSDLTSSGSASSPPDLEQSSRTKSSKASPLAPDASRVEKRRANTMAARRYRQKRVDQMSGLESELKEVKTERDDLKVRCARLEGEVETLRALLRAQK